jgi:radical SAM superfamily enzyme YgiQ (UPF0313 family)
MRITFVGIGWEQLGISMMSALARLDGHKVSMAFSPSLFNDRLQLTAPTLISSLFDDTDVVLKMIERQRPDVIACAPVSGTYQTMLHIAEQAKRARPNVKVIFGGIHATAVPERVLAKPFVDYVCVGEGEVAFQKILQAIENGGPTEPIPNTQFKLPHGHVVKGPQVGFIQDLDALPIYDKTIWEEYMKFDDTYIAMASRGCPYRCTFCFNSFFAKLPEERAGKYVRQRSVEHMLHELKVYKRRYHFKMVEFFDDVFTVNKKWLKEFLYRYKQEIGVVYQIFTHLKYVDEETAKWLSETGCRTAQIGMQSVDDQYKHQNLKRYETLEQAARVLEITKKYGIKVKLDHMFGLPGETLEAQEKALHFYEAHTPYRITTYWTNFFPGTEMLKQQMESGNISPEEAEIINEGKCFDSFTVTNKYIEQAKLKTYKAYETMFRLIPGLPAPWRQYVRMEYFRRLPFGLLSLINLCGHIVIGITRWDPDTWYYFNFYRHHLWRFVLVRLGLNPPPATPIRDARPFRLTLEKKEQPQEFSAVHAA